ncbi:MAG: hypothetical protein AAF919_09875 [Pseudomonadota bacterium]
MWWTAFKYLLVGALFALVGTVFVGSSQGFVKRSEPAQLIVLDMHDKRDPDGGIMYRPVFGLDTDMRPRPEYSGNIWMWPAPHETGDIVSGRYDAESGEMRSDRMIGRGSWIGRFGQILGGLVMLQGVLMVFGVPEVLLPIRVRIGGRRRRSGFQVRFR